MDWKLLRGTGRPGPYRVPNNYFGEYYSTGYCTAPEDLWVTGRFSPSDENILFIGSDTGRVCMVDVEKAGAPAGPVDGAFKYYFPAHKGVVMDIIPVPGKPDEVLTMSAYDIRIWTLAEPLKSSLFLGHEKSVRAASFVPDSSDLFASGDRDGSILMWDRRVALIGQNQRTRADALPRLSHRRPTKEYKNCHMMRPTLPQQAASNASGARRRSAVLHTGARHSPSITSMTHLDEYTIISCSEAGKSGIRLWDTRRMPVKEESRPLAVLELPSSNGREAGVSSICLDRFKSSLFAVSTDNCIYEFHPNSGLAKPVRSYVGACIDGDFYMQMACSPISDHIVCGSGDKRALIWDAQKFHSYADQPSTGPASASFNGIRPSLSLGGHNKKVSTVGYSANAMYMLTMDGDEFRIWQRRSKSTEEEESDANRGAAYERVETMEQPKEEMASRVLESFSITPGPRLFLSPIKAGKTPLQERKEPFASPFKSGSASKRLFGIGKENIPPGGVKKAKVEDEEAELRRKEEERRRREERRRNPFYFKHPTMHLPNLVYERYARQQQNGTEMDEGGEKRTTMAESEKKSARKVLTLEGWARSSDGRLSKKASLPSIDEHPRPTVPVFPTTRAAVAAGTPAASPRKLLQLRQTPKSGPRNLRDYFRTNRTADNL